jgi:hypothetical protein
MKMDDSHESMHANSRTSAKSIILVTVASALIALMLGVIGWWLRTIIIDFKPYWTAISAFVLGYLAHYVVVNGLPSITLGVKARRVLNTMSDAVLYSLSAFFTVGLVLIAHNLIVAHWTPILWVVGIFATWLTVGWASTVWSRKRR